MSTELVSSTTPHSIGIIMEDATTTIATGVEVTSNIADVLSSAKPTKAETKRKKGRPVMHNFAGRITLLREEVALALENGPAFIDLMQQDHKLDSQRIDLLMAEGKLSEKFIDMYYTYQGEIQIVLEEISTTMKRWEDRAVEMRVDFKKKRVDPTAGEPERLPDGKIEKIEAYPDRIYGFLKIRYANPNYTGPADETEEVVATA